MTSDDLSQTLSLLGKTLKSLAKCLLQSKRPLIMRERKPRSRRLIIMGNGPSLRATIDSHSDKLAAADTLAVNFAANSPEFARLKPQYYILADPHFFTAADPNVDRLWSNLAGAAHEMTLIVPARFLAAARERTNGRRPLLSFNFVGAEGFDSVVMRLFDSGRAMPRPRNVLIPAIMCGIWLGYKEIALTGADHSWTRTLDVDDNNRVVSVQPHFYSDNADERRRVASVYENVRLHQILASFAIAFRAYHDIARYAARAGVTITNATPGSFIDAFPRAPL